MKMLMMWNATNGMSKVGLRERNFCFPKHGKQHRKELSNDTFNGCDLFANGTYLINEISGETVIVENGKNEKP
jgi:hypothetical protein